MNIIGICKPLWLPHNHKQKDSSFERIWWVHEQFHSTTSNKQEPKVRKHQPPYYLQPFSIQNVSLESEQRMCRKIATSFNLGHHLQVA